MDPLDDLELNGFKLDVRLGEGSVDAAWISVAGEVDLATASELDLALRSVAGGTPVLLDVREVTFMDSSGLAAVMDAADRIGPQLVIVVVPDSAIDHLFDLTGTRELLRLYASEGAAMRALGAGP